MPEETFTFSVRSMQVMDENGVIDKKLMPQISEDDIKKMYEFMVLARVVDDRILKLQREGRCGTYGSSLGQEAVQVGSALALEDEDWLFPYFRDIGANLIRKIPAANYILYWMGDERGMKIPESTNTFMQCIPVATQVQHAAGAAFTMKYKNKGNAVLVYLGDGATSEGDFHEGMNFAGVMQLPVVFVCQNNQYAISMPVKKQTASKTLAQKAIAYGFEGIRVDGNDVFAVFSATKAALEKARSGKGPTFIECLTYRIGDHTTSDDASRYRSEEEVDAWKKKDPIERLKKFMQSRGLWANEYEETTKNDAEDQADQAIKEAESIPDQKLEDIFSYTYAEMPKNLKEQLKEAEGKE
jgi:pyruvate dehydrogenase E1 component alpha subunit